MSRWTRGIMILVPVIVLAIVVIQFFEISDALSKVSMQGWKLSNAQNSQETKGGRWNNLMHLGLEKHPQIGKCTVMHGDLNDAYKKALQTHLDHSQQHGYPTFVLDRIIIDGLWTKEAALLGMMLEALSKPKGERLGWILWFDADTVVMNKLIPLEVFLPPDDRHDVHLMYTKDWNGLNNGVFLLRVSEWSVQLLSAIVAYRTFKPEDDLPFTEQTAMEKVIELDQYKNGTVQCPQQWFNAYPNDGDQPDQHFHCIPGELLVHYAGVGDKSKAIGEWLKKLKDDRGKWEIPLAQTNYEQQIAEFWKGLEVDRNEK